MDRGFIFLASFVMADLSLSERGNNRWALRETKECSGQGVIPSISNPQKNCYGSECKKGEKT